MEALLDTVAAVKALLEGGRKLLRKFLPGPLSNLQVETLSIFVQVTVLVNI